MQLIYTSADEQTIQCTLGDGETLGNHAGPCVIFVPVDPANKEFQAIVESNEPIAPYEPPPPAEPQPLTLAAHPEAEMDATTLGYVQVYVTTEISPLRERVEALEARMAAVDRALR